MQKRLKENVCILLWTRQQEVVDDICACIWFQTEEVSEGVFLYCHFSAFSTILSVDEVIILGADGTHTVSVEQRCCSSGVLKACACRKQEFLLGNIQFTVQTLGWDNIPAKLGTLKKKNTVSLTFITAHFMFLRMRVISKQIRRSLDDIFKMPTCFSLSICCFGCHNMFYFWAVDKPWTEQVLCFPGVILRHLSGASAINCCFLTLVLSQDAAGSSSVEHRWVASGREGWGDKRSLAGWLRRQPVALCWNQRSYIKQLYTNMIDR